MLTILKDPPFEGSRLDNIVLGFCCLFSVCKHPCGTGHQLCNNWFVHCQFHISSFVKDFT